MKVRVWIRINLLDEFIHMDLRDYIFSGSIPARERDDTIKGRADETEKHCQCNERRIHELQKLEDDRSNTDEYRYGNEEEYNSITPKEVSSSQPLF